MICTAEACLAQLMLEYLALLELDMNAENQNTLQEAAACGRFAGKLERLPCINFQSLKNWQIRKYRDAVDEHRQQLSRELGSFCISWEEAERDFGSNRVNGHAEQWRHQYCGSICPFRNSCLLAYQFKWARVESELARTG
jgi:hypothetical protein